MEAILAPLFFVILLIFAPFIALNAYLLVWICGPAIRRAGRRFAEGWVEVTDRRELQRDVMTHGITPLRGAPGARRTAPAVAEAKAPEPQAITPDAGHAWLGNLK